MNKETFIYNTLNPSRTYSENCSKWGWKGLWNWKENKLIEDANKLAEGINGLTVTITAKTIEGGKQLFGSVTSNHLADELEKLGHTVDRKFVKLNNIKTVGTYAAEVRLHREVKAAVTVEVVAQ